MRLIEVVPHSRKKVLHVSGADMSVISGHIFADDGPQVGKRFSEKVAQESLLEQVKACPVRVDNVGSPGARGCRRD